MCSKKRRRAAMATAAVPTPPAPITRIRTSGHLSAAARGDRSAGAGRDTTGRVRLRPSCQSARVLARPRWPSSRQAARVDAGLGCRPGHSRWRSVSHRPYRIVGIDSPGWSCPARHGLSGGSLPAEADGSGRARASKHGLAARDDLRLAPATTLAYDSGGPAAFPPKRPGRLHSVERHFQAAGPSAFSRATLPCGMAVVVPSASARPKPGPATVPVPRDRNRPETSSCEIRTMAYAPATPYRGRRPRTADSIHHLPASAEADRGYRRTHHEEWIVHERR